MNKILFSNNGHSINNINQILVSDEIDYFHLNKPEFDYLQLKKYINLIDENLHYKIVIHSHYSLINEFELAGVCLNKKALSQLAYADEVDKCFIQPLVLINREIEINREKPNLVSYSAHSISEIMDLPFNVEYTFLSLQSQIYSKEGYLSKFSLIKLKEDLEKLSTKVIALGSVTLLEVEHLQTVGFDGCALSTDL